MKKTLMIALLAAFAGSGAFAATADCEAKAVGKDGKSLAGAAKASFIKKCEADAGGASQCEAMATDKKLAGAAKTSFVTKCEKDSKPAMATTCATKAIDKNGKALAGAAKTSFMKKCEADAKG